MATATAFLVGTQFGRRTIRRTTGAGVALLLLVLLFAPLLLGTTSQTPCRPTSAVAVGDVPTLTAAQLANAQIIAAEGIRAGVGVPGVTVALVAAMQESRLQNLTYGDQDSLGLFQQRPSAGWGSPAAILDPALAADAFYGMAAHTANRGLTDIVGWQALSIGAAAQAVQRSAFPGAYDQWIPAATGLAQRLLGRATGLASSGTNPSVSAQPISATTSRYALGPVQPNAIYVANLVGPMFGIRTIGGYRPTDDIDPSGHPAGLALDFMTNDIPDGAITGSAVAAYLQEHAAELDVKYVIWQQHIWSPARAAEGWRLMPDRGNPTANHMDHVHLSLNGTGQVTAANGCGGGGGAGGWYAGTSGDVADMDNATIIGTWSDTSADVQTSLPGLDGLRDATGQPWTGAVDIAVGGTVLGSGETYAQAAAGAFDARWRAAAETLKAKRANATGPTFVRPWHEFNGDWYREWEVTSATLADYKAAFRRWAGIIRSVMPEVYITWSPNDGSHLDITGAAAYPGDDLVDVIGVDSYDFHPPGSSADEITTAFSRGSITAPEGIETWRQFAELHGKPVALPEWGVCPVGNGCGGDHPEYITAMHTWMDAHANPAAFTVGQPIPAEAAGSVLYSIYFDVVHMGTSGFTLAANPRSANEYHALSWGN